MSAFIPFPSLFAAALVFLLALTHLDAKSVTVDDAETDKIIYSSIGWKVGNTCTDCDAKPDTTRVNTWHDGLRLNDTSPVFFTFTFTGTSVEVKYVAYYPVNVSYSIDNVQGTAIGRTIINDPFNNAYNQTLFRQDGLANVQHTLRVDISSKPSTFLFDYIIYDDGTVVAGSNTMSSTVLSASSSPTNDRAITGVSPGSSPNVGAIVGGVVASVMVGAGLIWYLRRRSQQNSQSGMFPFLESGSGANGKAPPSGAQTQELPGSHYYAPSGVASQVFYNSLPTTEALVPRPPPSSQPGTTYTPVTSQNPSGAFHTGKNSNHAASTTPSGPSATTEGDIPSDPEVHRGTAIHALEMPPSYTQGPLSGANNVAANVQGQIPSEPVEEGLMSGRRRGKYP